MPTLQTQTTSLGAFPALVAGDGPPLVFLAGLYPTTGVSSMRKVHETGLAPYADCRRVHYVNRRAGLPPGMSIGQLATEIADGIAATFDGPVDVIGLSTGGSIAQQLAADHPDRVRGLVLLSTGCRLSDECRLEMRRIAARLHAGAPRRALALAASVLAPDGRWVLPLALAGAFARRFLSDEDLADLATTIDLEDPFSLARCAAPIAAPTLIIAGDRDRFYPRSLLEETRQAIPGSRLLVVTGQGHMAVTGIEAVHRAALDHLDAAAASLMPSRVLP